MARTSLRWPLWALAVLLLLKAAMPLLAGVSAQAQGKAVAEICTVFGVSLVALDAPDRSSAPDSASGHGPDHCALTGLAAFATPAAVPAAAPQVPYRAVSPPRAVALAPARDPCARWAARLRHGPPEWA